MLEGSRETRVDTLIIDDIDAIRLTRGDKDDEIVRICVVEGAFDEESVNVERAKLNVGTVLLLTVDVENVLALEESDPLLL